MVYGGDEVSRMKMSGMKVGGMLRFSRWARVLFWKAAKKDTVVWLRDAALQGFVGEAWCRSWGGPKSWAPKAWS